MYISRFDFIVPDYTIWRAQCLKSIPSLQRPERCVPVTVRTFYRASATKEGYNSFLHQDIDDPTEGFPLVCHFLGYWKHHLNDNGELLLVHIPSDGKMLDLALRFPAHKTAAYRLQ